MNANASALEPVAGVNPQVTWINVVQSFFSHALRYDYLSSGRNHQQSRRVLSDRMALDTRRAELPLPAPAHKASKLCTQDPEQIYLSQVAQIKRLTSSEEYCLAKRVRSGDAEARNAMVSANLGLVVMLAQRYQRPGVPLLDLVAEGNFGLFAAAKGFDPELGFRFSTYAKWAVRHSIERSLPRLQSARRAPAQQLTNAPAEGLTGGGDYADFQSIAADPTDAASAGQARDQLGVEQFVTATDVSVSDEDCLSTLTIPEDEEPPQTTQTSQRNATLARAIEGLSERERTIIQERYALQLGQAATLEQLAVRFGVSIERVRQIELAALKKLANLLRELGASADTLL